MGFGSRGAGVDVHLVSDRVSAKPYKHVVTPKTLSVRACGDLFSVQVVLVICELTLSSEANG